MNHIARPSTPSFYTDGDCALDEFVALTAQSTDLATLPHASAAPQNVPVYDAPTLPLADPDARQAVMAEWAGILCYGAGVFVLRQACADHAAIDDATQLFNRLIAEAKGEATDHFAAAGHNDRLWNAQQKLCLAAPGTFLRYMACPAIDAACEAWLGPDYQMTAQVNVVHPGGAAQSAHRDYHLGFQTAAGAARFPAHVHALSPFLTLQGGLAHGDVPLESGPTKLLPFSQTYGPGYLAMHRPEFRAHFEAASVQLPLQKGDALFFNPALFHAAGDNRSADIHRMVNLFQVSSAFGRAMESVDRLAMCEALYAPLQAAWAAGKIDALALDAILAASAEGYAFPTNLDRDPPLGGLAPQSQQALMREAVLEGRAPDTVIEDLRAQAQRRGP